MGIVLQFKLLDDSFKISLLKGRVNPFFLVKGEEFIQDVFGDMLFSELTRNYELLKVRDELISEVENLKKF